MTLGPCGVYQQRSRGFHYLFDLAVACLRGCSTPLGVLELRFGAERVQLLLRQGVAVVFGSPLTDSVNGYSHLAAAVSSFQYSVPTGWYMSRRAAPAHWRRLLSGTLCAS